MRAAKPFPPSGPRAYEVQPVDATDACADAGARVGDVGVDAASASDDDNDSRRCWCTRDRRSLRPIDKRKSMVDMAAAASLRNDDEEEARSGEESRDACLELAHELEAEDEKRRPRRTEPRDCERQENSSCSWTEAVGAAEAAAAAVGKIAADFSGIRSFHCP